MNNTNLYIPICMDACGFDNDYEKVIDMLKKAGADRVYLLSVNGSDSEENKSVSETKLKKNIPIFENAGFEVGVWMSAFGHGGNETEKPLNSEGYSYMKSPDGKYNSGAFCPLDEKFVDSFCDWIKRIVRCGAKMIMLDDDYRMIFRSGKLYCCCPRHLALISEKMGREVKTEEIISVFAGPPSELRDAWLYAQGEGLLSFAKKMRSAVDEVNPATRLGHCAVLSTWDVDGADSIAISRALAGNTKPFLRLIGAAYWGKFGSFMCGNLATVIEYERLQRKWCEDNGIEIFAEGDVYPRPRYNIPASFLELFDAGIRASGDFDGILKYMFDYRAKCDLETGYLDRHNRNAARREWISNNFDGKEAVGLYIFEPMKTLNTSYSHDPVHERCISGSLRFVSHNAIPSKYSEGGITVVFGDAAEFIADEQLNEGAVIDGKAAEILLRRGFDIGIEKTGDKVNGTLEYFVSSADSELQTITALELEVSENAEILSKLDNKYPSIIKYEDARGRRFMILADISRNKISYFGYYRQRTFMETLEWVGRKKLPLVCQGHPYLYTIVKDGPDSRSAAFFNIFEDEIIAPTIKLDSEYSRVESFECTAELDGDRVKLSDISPFGFAAFTVYK